MRVRLFVTVLVAVLATGCSDASGPDEPEVDQEVIRAGLAELFTGDHPEAADVDAGECFARELTARTTPAQLQEAGVLDEDYTVVTEPGALPEPMAEQWVDAQFACTDFVAESTRALTAQTKGRLDAEVYAACLAGLLDDEAQRAASVATLTGDWDSAAVTALSDAQLTCADQAEPAG